MNVLVIRIDIVSWEIKVVDIRHACHPTRTAKKFNAKEGNMI
jgi:hypothetical protein